MLLALKRGGDVHMEWGMVCSGYWRRVYGILMKGRCCKRIKSRCVCSDESL